ncbi:MAG: FkbM family methyltransferase [Rubrivivax sp.]|nr:FkbM family methyltransferase [Rubrivivax sp.]
MKQALGWWFPDHEQHLIAWMEDAGNRIEINGRPAYQGKKQLAALATVARMKRSPLRMAVDVGGHVGLWSYNLAPAFQAVLAFEPVHTMRECFERNVTAENVEVLPIALGAEDGSVSMHTTPHSTGDSWVAGDGPIQMRTLDSFNLSAVDFVKIDCEGYEELVLRGAVETIQRCRPVIIVEQKRDMATRFGLKPQGAVQLLRQLGYGLEREIGGDFLMVPA